jgi:hypothetical protein
MLELREQIKVYQDEIKNSNQNNGYAAMARFNLDLILEKTPVIEHLSKFNVIPRYGFPIDNVDLKIFNPNKGMQNDSYRLNRDLSIAISEFAPDSEVIVDKQTYTSRYIILPPEKLLPQGFYAQCPHCLKINVDKVSAKNLENCLYCQKPLSLDEGVALQKSFLIPRYGFYTDYTQTTSRTQKPKKTFAGEISYASDGELISPIETISPLVKVSKFKHSELMVLNENPFYMCENCGYTLLIKDKNIPYFNDTKNHIRYNGKSCSSKRLKRITLGHSFRTDVAVIEIDFDISHQQAISTLYALLEGVSQSAQIERRDINGVLAKRNDRYQFVLYDNVPGGAGHTSKLSTSPFLNSILKQAYKIVDQDCCEEDTSCYNCLRNYSNSKKHGELSRRSAKFVLRTMLNSFSLIQNPEQ